MLHEQQVKMTMPQNMMRTKVKTMSSLTTLRRNLLTQLLSTMVASLVEYDEDEGEDHEFPNDSAQKSINTAALHNGSQLGVNFRVLCIDFCLESSEWKFEGETEVT